MVKAKVETTFNGWFFGMREYCGNCMEEIDSEDVFCSHCGERFETNKDRVIALLGLDGNTSVEECANKIKNENYEFCEKCDTCKDCILHLNSSNPRELCRSDKSLDEIENWLKEHVMEWK